MAYVMRMCGSPADTDDVTQESFCRLLVGPIPEMTHEQLKSYLFRVATNLVRDRYRSQERRRGLLTRWLPRPSTTSSPDELDRRADFEKVFSEMKARERELLWLAYVEGFEHREIAEILALKRDSIRPLLFRARTRLAERLKARGVR